jgi:hypothetical protein
MNEIVTNAKPLVENNRLAMDAPAAAFNALSAKLEAITSRVHGASRLIAALDRASWDRNSKYSKLDAPAAIAKLNDLRAQFIPDTVALDDMLTEPATKAQLKSLAGILPGVYGKGESVDQWLAGVFVVLTCREFDSDGDLLVADPISAPIMAKAIIKLLNASKFLPAPCEFYDACSAVRRGVRRLRDEIIRLAKLPPPRLPELPPPAPAQIEHKPDVWEEMMMAESAAMPDPFGRSPERLHGQTED